VTRAVIVAWSLLLSWHKFVLSLSVYGLVKENGLKNILANIVFFLWTNVSFYTRENPSSDIFSLLFSVNH